MTLNYKQLRTLTVRFDLPIRFEELSKFRGAIINLTKEKNDLFHNHSETGVIYRYPKIQYKKLAGQAALLCIDEGTEAIHDFFNGFKGSLKLGSENLDLKVVQIKANQTNVGIWDTIFDYHLANWLPLNQENYQRFQESESLHEKIQILENVLIGNLLTFCEGISIKPEMPLKAVITKIVREKRIKYRGTAMQAYDIDIKSNLSIPDLIGLGKGSGLGFGVVTAKRNPKKQS